MSRRRNEPQLKAMAPPVCRAQGGRRLRTDLPADCPCRKQSATLEIRRRKDVAFGLLMRQERLTEAMIVMENAEHCEQCLGSEAGKPLFRYLRSKARNESR